MSIDLSVERLFGGQPLLAPQGDGWESGAVFNTAAVYLPAKPGNVPAIQALLGEEASLRDIVVLHYRARPKVDKGFRHTRSYVGVSVHKPDLTPIRRFAAPVLAPGATYDALGVEDPRVARLDDAWWMVYCGVASHRNRMNRKRTWLGSVCTARSTDLLNWEKRSVAPGISGGRRHPHSNKDGVLFPDRIEGKVMLLHRPMVGPNRNWTVNLASADQPEGPYQDRGRIHGAAPSKSSVSSWVGAGATPIKIGEGRYVSIEHTGSFLPSGQRRYVLDAFLYDFNRFHPRRPKSLMAARLDDFMRPETDFEVHGPFPESVANVVFCCGSYVHDGWLYLVYGGGDSYILAARVRFDALVRALEARIA